MEKYLLYEFLINEQWFGTNSHKTKNYLYLDKVDLIGFKHVNHVLIWQVWTMLFCLSVNCFAIMSAIVSFR